MLEDQRYIDFCVGELTQTDNGKWEVSVAVSANPIEPQKIVATCDSQGEAVKVLWEQRNNLNWGYYQ